MVSYSKSVAAVGGCVPSCILILFGELPLGVVLAAGIDEAGDGGDGFRNQLIESVGDGL